ncbi:tetratricopeptide repeat protein [Actinoplanes sp. NPDC051859]|uniref:tetratricopeptide repeat protein n=1 Tax=Actinoplanes sp. NPDC051859 TaxID=3363909 RepID=UPI0037AD1FB6
MSSEPTPQSEPETTPEEYRSRALLLADLGRYDEAAGEISAGLSVAPGDVGLLVTLARLHVAAGQAVAALDAANRAAQTSPAPIDVLVVRAMALTDDRRFSEAAQVATEILTRWPEDPFAQRTGAALLSESRNGQDALNAAWNGVRLSPRDAEAHLVLAMVSARLRLFDLAQRGYSEALDLDERIGDAQREVGVVRLERRRWALALEQLADEATLQAVDPATRTDADPAAGEAGGPTAGPFRDGSKPDDGRRGSAADGGQPHRGGRGAGTDGGSPGGDGSGAGTAGDGSGGDGSGAGTAGDGSGGDGSGAGTAGDGSGGDGRAAGAGELGSGDRRRGGRGSDEASEPTGRDAEAAGWGAASAGQDGGAETSGSAASETEQRKQRRRSDRSWGQGQEAHVPHPEVVLPTGPVLDRSQAWAEAVRQAVLIGSNGVLIAAVLSAVMTLTSTGVARTWAGMMGVVILIGVTVWLGREVRPDSIGTVLERTSRRLSRAAYATLTAPLLLVLHAAIGGLVPLVAAMVVAALAELFVLTRRS